MIKPADKGGAVVVSKTESLQKRDADNSMYARIQDPQAALINAQTRSRKKVIKFFENKNWDGKEGLLQAPTRDFLLAFQSAILYLYLQTKIHNAINTGTRTWQGRPGLRIFKAPTRPVDWICTALLITLLQLLPVRLRVTTDFLETLATIRGPAPRGDILFSMDAVSLYTSIPQRKAATEVANFFDTNKHMVRTELREAEIRRTPPRILLEAAILHVMRDIILEFNGETYRQRKEQQLRHQVA